VLQIGANKPFVANMLKRIHVEHVQLGMHIQSFCGSWMDHPFWRSKFVLNDPKDLHAIRSSAVREVWIDTDKGIDVPADSGVSEQAQTEEQVTSDAVYQHAVTRVLEASSTEVELARAAAICNSARGVISSMFQDARMGKAINRVVVRQVAEEIADSVTRNAGALINLARLKTADDYSYMHSVAVCALMVALARQTGMDDAQSRAAGFAGLLHDLGKMDVPLDLLNKPGKLTDDEFHLVRLHPVQGHQRLLDAGVTEEAALDVCLHHHEKMDGTGYPHGLAGEQISVWARMGAICDVYDAITSNRPYKQGWDPAESLKRMASWKGHFDGRLFQAFVRSLGIYPAGSLVKLSSGKLAVVVEQSAGSLLKPVVKTVFSTNSGERLIPERIDLSAPTCRVSIVSREDPEQWKIPDLAEVWLGMRWPQ
jgi:HD-GYP domain-containing protein (c-di-GMP phosphodiesterase class II)